MKTVHDKMFLIRDFMIATWMLKCLEGYCGAMTIGIITQDTSRLHGTILDIGHNISIDSYIIDTRELYQLYKTVHLLDRNESIDVILLFDENRIPESSRYLLTPSNKKLITWTKEGGTIEMVDIYEPFSRKTGLCDIIIIPGYQSLECHNRNMSRNCKNYLGSKRIRDDPYCVMDLDSPKDNRNEGIATLVPKLLTAAVLSLSWKRVIIFYESATEIETSTVVDVLSQFRIMCVMFNIEHVDDINALLRRIYETKEEKDQPNPNMNIVVLCNTKYTAMLLRKAYRFDKSSTDRQTLMKKFSKWLIVGYGYCHYTAAYLQVQAGDLYNVAVIAMPTEFSSSKEFVSVLNDIIYDVHKIYPQNNDSRFTTALVDRIEQSTRSKCDSYIIDTLLWTKSPRVFNRIGHIGRDGHMVLDTDIFPNTHYGYNKKEFIISTLPYPPFVIMTVVNGTKKYKGLCMDLLEELSRVLNFTYKFTEPPDGLWGAFVGKNNFTFNGMVGQAQRQEVDIIGGPLIDHPERRQVIDLSVPFYYDYVTVIFKKPNLNARKWRKLLDPLNWEVLVLIGVALILVTVLMYILEKNNRFYLKAENAELRDRIGGLNTIRNTLWYSYGTLLVQGGVHLPGSFTGRTIVYLWWLFCIIIVGIYRGNLIAFLTVTKEVPPFNTLSEMLGHKGTYTWGTMGGTAWEMILRTSTNPTFRAVGDAMIEFNRSDPEVLSPSIPEQLKKVRKGGYVWIGDKTSIELEMMTECDLMSTKEEFMPSSYAFGFTKNSPHESLFSKQIMTIEESGLLQVWKQKWWPKANFCGLDTVAKAKQISLEDVQSAFYACCIGIFIGTVALSFEIIIHKLFKKKLVSTDNDLTNDK